MCVIVNDKCETKFCVYYNSLIITYLERTLKPRIVIQLNRHFTRCLDDRTITRRVCIYENICTAFRYVCKSIFHFDILYRMWNFVNVLVSIQ